MENYLRKVQAIFYLEFRNLLGGSVRFLIFMKNVDIPRKKCKTLL